MHEAVALDASRDPLARAPIATVSLEPPLRRLHLPLSASIAPFTHRPPLSPYLQALPDPTR